MRAHARNSFIYQFIEQIKAHLPVEILYQQVGSDLVKCLWFDKLYGVNHCRARRRAEAIHGIAHSAVAHEGLTKHNGYLERHRKTPERKAKMEEANMCL